MTLALIDPPAVEPVTLAEAKAFLRVDTVSDDNLILSLIRAARQHVEADTGLALITQTWRHYSDCFPRDGVVRLQRHPVRAIVAVTAYDASGAPQLVAGSAYRFNAIDRPARLVFHAPVDASNGLEIDFEAGFGDTGVDVPDGIRRAMLMLVAHGYEFRGAVTSEHQPAAVPTGYERLIAHWRRLWL